MAQVFAISINGSCSSLLNFAMGGESNAPKATNGRRKSRLPFLPLFRTTAGN
jgi:hypothetical protein